jgi:hypothetical protein
MQPGLISGGLIFRTDESGALVTFCHRHNCSAVSTVSRALVNWFLQGMKACSWIDIALFAGIVAWSLGHSETAKWTS